jgi:serine/threonine protein kinase/Tol biopolymer transport system component
VTTPADRLSNALSGRYRIERELGAGGMATVYLAFDEKHDRKVAIKVLKPELAAVIGAERFLAEIKTTANLQHPHILALFDSGQVEGTVFYVMPFVDGESLRDRLEREKQLPIEDALRIAREVGDALQYAHGHGVIHRDIKPENILLHGGHALVADFGIALAAAKTGGARMTETGMSLGTPTYMSPEQAMGERTLDARSDLYALGCVLYEMLTGEAPFTGATAQAIVAKVLTEKPAPIVGRRDRVPPHVEDAILTALEKLPADRFASAAEFVAALGGAGGAHRTAPARSATRASHSGWRVATGVLSLAVVALALTLLTRSAPNAGRVVRIESLSDDPPGSLLYAVAGAPDGSSYITCTSAGIIRIRRWDTLTPVQIAGGLRGCLSASYSPNAKFVALLAYPSSVQIISTANDAPPREIKVDGLEDVAVYGGGIDWADDGNLYVASREALRRVSPTGGDVDVLARWDSTRAFDGLDVLPGARYAITVNANRPGADQAPSRIDLVDLATGSSERIIDGVAARFVAPGHLLIARADGSLVSVPFDAGSRRVTGEPRTLADSVPVLAVAGVAPGLLDVAADGTLLYWRTQANRSAAPVIVDRGGVVRQAFDDATGSYFVPRFSPDGSRIVVDHGEIAKVAPQVRDIRTGASRQLDPPGRVNSRPAWMPDGKGVSFLSDRDGPMRLYHWRLDEDVARAAPSYDARSLFALEWSRDGRWLLLRTDDQAPGKGDILAVRPGVDSVARPIVAAAQFSEYAPSLSPDGKWLAYVSDESGRFEVRVTSFPDARERWQVSVAGGSEPVWTAGGRELIYVADDGFVTAATVATGTEFRVTERRRLFAMAPFANYRIFGRNYDVSRDGQRFVMLRYDAQKAVSLVVVQNWAASLRQSAGSR